LFRRFCIILGNINAFKILYTDEAYPGGIKQYVENAKKLLKASAENFNPYSDFDPEFPSGSEISFFFSNNKNILEKERFHIDFSNQAKMDELEEIGMKEMKHMCFCLGIFSSPKITNTLS